jgi:predicted ATPase/class 3 adenylate cyclase
MPNLPAGTVTLLFTDIEGSTRLLQQLGERYARVLADCRQLLRAIFARWDGHEVDTQGDGFFVAFARATDAAAAAVNIQRALASHPCPDNVTVRVRIGLHTGEPKLSSEGYIGLDVHHAARIMSAGHGGQILLSPTTRPLVEQYLPEGTYLQDLGEHRLKDLHRPTHLFQLSVSDLPDDFPPLKTLDTSPNNLPIQPTAFIGREKEVAQVCTLLRRPDVRMVTLTGPGGVGKTRLSLQVGAELSDLFVNGVFIVVLAPVSDPAQVVPTIAQTLGIGEASDQPLLPLLEAALKGKQLLLLLDNFEHVVDAAVVVAELLTVCPRLKILVTSRVGLHVRAEQEFAVPPLAVPATKRLPGLQALLQYEAVALFISRVQAVKPDFQVTNANAPAVAAICARLDGLPLALELAAARVKYFPPQTLLARLEQDLSILSGGARDLPARQQTLRATIAWSYELLSPEEQALFRRFAVFLDGCSWEAAEQVCNAAQELPMDMLEGLASLVDKSLLRQEEQAQGEARFWMLQTLREFGLERLSEAGEMETTREAHALYYLTLAEEADRHRRGKEQSFWLTQLEQEHENLRAALSWLLEWARVEGKADRQHQEEALRFCAAMRWFWSMRGYIREGRTYLERALAKRAEVSPRVQAPALMAAAELAFYLDDYERTEALAGEGLAFYRELADSVGMANCLFHLASVSWARSQYAQARSRYEEAEALVREGGDAWLRARCLSQLARISSCLGDYDAAHLLLEQTFEHYRILDDTERMGWVLYYLAQVLFMFHPDLERAYSRAEQSLTHLREVNSTQGMGYVLSLLGLISLVKGEQMRARELAEEGLTLLREIGDRAGTAESLIGLAWILATQGDNVEASRLYFESFSILQEIQDNEFVPSCLEGLAAVEVDLGEPAWALRLLGKAAEWRKRIGTPLPPVYRARYEQAVATARTGLSEEAFEAAWSEGQTMKLEQVLLAPNI